MVRGLVGVMGAGSLLQNTQDSGARLPSGLLGGFRCCCREDSQALEPEV